MSRSKENRVYVPFDAHKGYPAGKHLFYECLNCGDSLPSIPPDNIHCSCENIRIDVDFGRMIVRDNDLIRLFRTESE